MKEAPKETAVEYIVKKLISFGYLHSDDYGQGHAITILIEQSIEMEKDQIIDFAKKYEYYSHRQAQASRYNFKKNAETYYKKTYGK